MASGEFDSLFARTRPHILEKIILSLDYNTFKNCLVINKAWKTVLTATSFQKQAKAAFREEILKDEMRLVTNSREGNTDEVRKLLSVGLLDVDCVDRGWTPLQYASEKGHKDVVKLLLDKGADPKKADDYENFPLHNAAEDGHKDVVQLLLDRGADPNKAEQDGRTPLHDAAHYGHKDVVQILLNRGSDPDRRDHSGNSALDLAQAAIGPGPHAE